MKMVELIESETNRYAKRFYKLLFENGYELANGSRYVLTKIHVTIECPHGHIYETTPDNFIGSKNREGKRCSDCYGNKKYTTKEFEKRIFDLFKNEFSVLGEYINSNTPVLVRHNNVGCGNYEWKVYPSNLIHKNQFCPKCAGNAREGIDGFKKKVYELERENYVVIGDYINADTPIKMRHNNISCGNFEWEVIPFNFTTHGSRCPTCNESRGERHIRKYLEENDIEYTSQVKFDDCRNERPLPFDFGIYDNNNLVCLIEFNGIQHYEPTFHFGGEKQFEIRKKRDNIKRNYCKTNNIPLIEIPYRDMDRVEEILDKEINNLFETV